MRRAPSISVSADGSNRGRRQEEEWDEAMQEEYVLELATLEAGAPPSRPAVTVAPEPTELDKAGIKVQIETERRRKWPSLASCCVAFPKKLRGGLDRRLPIPPLLEVLWSFIGAFIGIMAVAVLNEWVSPEINLPFIVGSFGASAVLIFAVVESKLSQPRNFVGGQTVSAIVGVVVRLIIHEVWIAQPVGMSLALVVMMLTSTTHPPGGATALIACSVTTIPKWAGFSFVVTVLSGSCVMLVVALIVNNASPGRQYPTFWY